MSGSTQHYPNVHGSLGLEIDYITAWIDDYSDLVPAAVAQILDLIFGTANKDQTYRDGDECPMFTIDFTADITTYRGTTPVNGPDPDDVVAKNHQLRSVTLTDLDSATDIELTPEQQQAIFEAHRDRIESVELEVPEG